MAIVKDKSRPEINADRPYTTHNRVNGGEPNGSVTPEFVGEIVLDSTNNRRWKAVGTGNAAWIAIDPA